MICKIHELWALDTENLLKYGNKTFSHIVYRSYDHGWIGMPVTDMTHYEFIPLPPLPDWIKQIKVDMENEM